MYPLEGNFNTYKNVPVLEIDTVAIEQERKRVKTLTSELNNKYKDYSDTGNREVSMTIDPNILDVIGKFACIYDPNSDSLHCKGHY